MIEQTPTNPDPETVFRANLETFGERASRLCLLCRTGRLTTDACFVALTQLWIQLAHAHRGLPDPGPSDPRTGDEGAPENDDRPIEPHR